MSPACLKRALRVADAILKTFKKRDIEIEVVSQRYGKDRTFAIVKGERIAFGILESPKKGIRHDDWSGKPTEGMVPSGKLVLRIRSDYSGDRCQFRDQKRKTVEDRLNEFIVELKRDAHERKRWRRRQEEERLEQERIRKEQAELERLRRAEEARIQGLYRQVNNWRKAQDVNAFVSAARACATKSEISDPAFERWTTWALEHASSIDPLNPPAKESRPWLTNDDPESMKYGQIEGSISSRESILG